MHWKPKLIKELNELKYERSQDFNLFLSNMINKLNKLQELDTETSLDEKFEYLDFDLHDVI